MECAAKGSEVPERALTSENVRDFRGETELSCCAESKIFRGADKFAAVVDDFSNDKRFQVGCETVRGV